MAWSLSLLKQFLLWSTALENPNFDIEKSWKNAHEKVWEPWTMSSQYTCYRWFDHIFCATIFICVLLYCLETHKNATLHAMLSHWAVPENIYAQLNWIPKNFRVSKKVNSSFCRIPNLADSKSWGIPEFCKTLQTWFRWNSCQNLQNFGTIHGFTVRLTKHLLQNFQCRPLVCMYIFWNSPLKVIHTKSR